MHLPEDSYKIRTGDYRTTSVIIEHQFGLDTMLDNITNVTIIKFPLKIRHHFQSFVKPVHCLVYIVFFRIAKICLTLKMFRLNFISSQTFRSIIYSELNIYFICPSFYVFLLSWYFSFFHMAEWIHALVESSELNQKICGFNSWMQLR